MEVLCFASGQRRGSTSRAPLAARASVLMDGLWRSFTPIRSTWLTSRLGAKRRSFGEAQERVLLLSARMEGGVRPGSGARKEEAKFGTLRPAESRSICRNHKAP